MWSSIEFQEIEQRCEHFHFDSRAMYSSTQWPAKLALVMHSADSSALTHARTHTHSQQPSLKWMQHHREKGRLPTISQSVNSRVGLCVCVCSSEYVWGGGAGQAGCWGWKHRCPRFCTKSGLWLKEGGEMQCSRTRRLRIVLGGGQTDSKTWQEEKKKSSKTQRTF